MEGQAQMQVVEVVETEVVYLNCFRYPRTRIRSPYLMITRQFQEEVVKAATVGTVVGISAGEAVGAPICLRRQIGSSLVVEEEQVRSVISHILYIFV